LELLEKKILEGSVKKYLSDFLETSNIGLIHQMKAKHNVKVTDEVSFGI